MGVVGIAVDISEQKRAEEALNRVNFAIERVADLVCWVDENARIVDANRSAWQRLGYTKEEMLNLSLADIDPDFDPDHWKLSWQNLLQNGSYQVERRHRTREGVIFPVEVSNNLIKFGGKELNCGLARDISLRKEVEKRLQQSNDELEQRVNERTVQLQALNKELEAFAYSVSHDLRAPLRAIDGYSRILVEDYEPVLDAEGKRVCGVIQNETRRMSHLIDDLLAFSRLNRTEMRLLPVDMDDLVKTVFAELVSLEKPRSIQFNLRPLKNVNGDCNLLRQVWVNLLSNAIKFTRQNQAPVIEVACEETDNEVIYWVRDNGAGFDMKYADKLFGVFQRLHSERDFDGTGVGLAIVQRIIQRHGGRVWADAVVDRGATFFFSLPLEGAK